MSDVEQAGMAVEVTQPSEAAAASALSKPWVKPHLETWSLVGQTEGGHGAGSDSAHCLS
jgi:hypothetical protein